MGAARNSKVATHFRNEKFPNSRRAQYFYSQHAAGNSGDVKSLQIVSNNLKWFLSFSLLSQYHLFCVISRRTVNAISKTSAYPPQISALVSRRLFFAPKSLTAALITRRRVTCSKITEMKWESRMQFPQLYQDKESEREYMWERQREAV